MKKKFESADLRHECSQERTGQLMTREEKHQYAVHSLATMYETTSDVVEENYRYGDHTIDLRIVRKTIFGEKIINFIVLCNEEAEDVEALDTSWLLPAYKTNGERPRLVIAKTMTADYYDTEPQCGEIYYFTYKMTSLLPDETNEPLDKVMNTRQLASLYAEAWKKLDISIVEPYLDKDFMMVFGDSFERIPCRAENLTFLKAKFEHLRQQTEEIKAVVGRELRNEDVSVLICEPKSVYTVEIGAQDGRIETAYVDESTEKIKRYYKKRELTHSHEDKMIAISAEGFALYMDGCDFDNFDNLMFVLEELPLLKLEDGYELDGFEVGNSYGASIKTYCCQKGVTESYDPKIHNEYKDTLRIDSRLSKDEADIIPPALLHIEVPFTKDGIMQAWLLSIMNDFMPKVWHANYSVKHYIFTEESLDDLFDDYELRRKGLGASLMRNRLTVIDKVLSMDISILLPFIEIKDDSSATLHYSYWNDWSGMNKAKVDVYNEGNTVRFEKPEITNLLKYSCGIMF